MYIGHVRRSTGDSGAGDAISVVETKRQSPLSKHEINKDTYEEAEAMAEETALLAPPTTAPVEDGVALDAEPAADEEDPEEAVKHEVEVPA